MHLVKIGTFDDNKSKQYIAPRLREAIYCTTPTLKEYFHAFLIHQTQIFEVYSTGS